MREQTIRFLGVILTMLSIGCFAGPIGVARAQTGTEQDMETALKLASLLRSAAGR